MRRLLFVSVAVCAAVCAAGLHAEKESGTPEACIIDLDGTIADESARRAAAAGEDGKLQGKEYEAYFDPAGVPGDKPMPKALETMKWLDGEGVVIFYVSSRPASMLQASKEWINEHGYPAGKEVHHKQKKFEKSVVYKTRAIEEIKKKGYDVLFGVGDRDKDIISYKEAGIAAIKVEPNSNDDWDRVRKKIEEILEKRK